MVADHLILPEGSVIKGSVVQVQPARRLSRNGQLRVLFHEVAPPNGIEQKVEASLEAVAVAKSAHLKLDAEGGAQVTTPRTRYLTTGIAVALAAGGSGDRDAGAPGQSVGEASKGAAQGASGFRLVGTVLSLTARSPALSATMGAYGAASSIYYHFLARGRDVVYPKDMVMIVGLGTRDSKPKLALPATSSIPPSQSPVESSRADAITFCRLISSEWAWCDSLSRVTGDSRTCGGLPFRKSVMSWLTRYLVYMRWYYAMYQSRKSPPQNSHVRAMAQEIEK